MISYKYVRILIPLLTIVCIYCAGQPGPDQNKQDPTAQLKGWIDSKKFRFHALSATSMKGRTTQLTSEYFLKLNNDSLQVELPYYGRSYSTNYPPTDTVRRVHHHPVQL